METGLLSSPKPRARWCATVAGVVWCLLGAITAPARPVVPPEKPRLPLLTRAAQIRNLTLAGPGSDLFIQDETAGIWVDTSQSRFAARPGQRLEVEGVSAAPDLAPQITPKRLARMVISMVALILAILVWVVVLRRQVREKTEMIREWLRREAALKEQYRELFENANDVVFTLDLAGNFTSLNKAGERVTGCTLQEISRMNFLDLVAPEHSEATRQRMESLVAGRSVDSGEIEIVTQDGRRVVLEVNSRLIYREGKLEGVQGIARDITERKRAGAALRESEDRYRDLVEHSEDLICTHDLEGRILSVNELPAKILGYEPGELLTKNIRDGLAPELREDFTNYISAIRRDGVAKGLMVVLTKSGKRRIWAYHNTLRTEGVAAPIVRGMAHDVTERKRAEQALAAERNLFHILMDGSFDTIYFKDSACRFTRINKAQAELLGLRDPEAVVGKTDFDFFPPEVAQEFYAEDQKILKTGQPLIAKIEHFHTPGGKEVWFLCTETPVTNKDGQVTGIVGISRDITELKRAEESLRQLSGHLLRLQDEERRRIARELHDSTAQVLAGLTMNLGLVKRSAAALDRKGRKFLSDSLTLAEQCGREIRTLSYLLHPPLLDEVGLVSALRWYAKGFAERSGIRVDLDVNPKLGRLSSETETTLFRVVQECLSNIHRHSGSPTASIRIEHRAPDVTLEVRDGGKGMRSDVWRAAGAVTALGVGIAGMRERLRQLGGRLEIDSGSRGTTVKAILPIQRGN